MYAVNCTMTKKKSKEVNWCPITEEGMGMMEGGGVQWGGGGGGGGLGLHPSPPSCTGADLLIGSLGKR